MIPLLLLNKPRSDVLFQADFTTASPGAGNLTNYRLSFIRSSSGYTVQTGTSSIAVGGSLSSNNVPRFGRARDTDNVGLVVEELRKSATTRPRTANDGSWGLSGGCTITQNDGSWLAADGTSGAGAGVIAHAVSGVQFNIYNNVNTADTNQTYSVWFKKYNSSTAYSISIDVSARTSVTNLVGILPTEWQRSPYITSTNHSIELPADTWHLGVNVDEYLDFIQMEGPGKFATEVIIGPATRQGEEIQYANGKDFLAAGSLRCYVKFRFKWNPGEGSQNPVIWFVNSNNYCDIDYTTGAVRVTIGGVTYTTPVTMSWVWNDVLELWVCPGGGLVPTDIRYRRNAGSWITLSTGSPPTQASIVITGAIDLFNKLGTNQINGWVEKVVFYADGKVPDGIT